jgi:mRNA-degrading endonuclease RelE of RelBE toxin-antitoxin system
MMEYSLEYTKRFLKRLKTLNKASANRILDAVDEILHHPYTGSVMVYAKERCWKWRVGNYGIIYIIDENEKKITLIIADHRKRIYERL